jgi:hypothetical protein
MSAIIGVIAEDDSDVEIVDELIKKILPQKRYSIKSFVGHGCGKVRGKCFQWANVLKTKGCSKLILLHDLDEHNFTSLNNQLCTALKNCSIPKHIVIIPIKEVEAWLLCDNQAIKRAMKLRENVPPVANPQAILDPKKKLGEIIYLRSGKTKRYLNSAHNRKIAAELNLASVRKCCTSYLPLERFVLENIK